MKAWYSIRYAVSAKAAFILAGSSSLQNRAGHRHHMLLASHAVAYNMSFSEVPYPTPSTNSILFSELVADV